MTLGSIYASKGLSLMFAISHVSGRIEIDGVQLSVRVLLAVLLKLFFAVVVKAELGLSSAVVVSAVPLTSEPVAVLKAKLGIFSVVVVFVVLLEFIGVVVVVMLELSISTPVAALRLWWL
jgi:hypothetical protein